jgi:acyl-CoA thioester hydrolase
MMDEYDHEFFPHSLSLRIDWADLDFFGHVNNVMFLKYIQASRVSYWEQTGIYQHFLQTRVGPMIVSVNCQYGKPLFYPGTVQVRTRMQFIRNTSFSLSHRILDEAGTLAAVAEDVMVMYDFNRDEKVLFSDDFRKKVEEFEKRKFPRG